MAKTRSNSAESKNRLLKIKKPVLKTCTIRLRRLSANQIDSCERLHKKISVSIHKNKLKLGDSTFKSRNLTFNLHLKVTSTEVAILNERPEVTISPRKLRCREKFVSNTHLPIVKFVPKPIVIKPRNCTKWVDEWRKCKNRDNFSVNDIVMGKVRGFLPWAGKIVEFIKKDKSEIVKIEFYGVDWTEKIGFVTKNELSLFKNCGHLIRAILQRNCPKFRKGIQEAEIICGIPEHLSVIRKCE